MSEDPKGSQSFVVGFPSGILDNESRKRSEPQSGSTRFTPPYHCLRNNCETFAVLCKTGNLDNGSDQGRILGEAIRRDLERENDSLLLHVLGASILYAQRFFVTRNN